MCKIKRIVFQTQILQLLYPTTFSIIQINKGFLLNFPRAKIELLIKKYCLSMFFIQYKLH